MSGFFILELGILDVGKRRTAEQTRFQDTNEKRIDVVKCRIVRHNCEFRDVAAAIRHCQARGGIA